MAAVDAGALVALSALLSTAHLATRAHALSALERICALVPAARLPADAVVRLSELCGAEQDAQSLVRVRVRP